MYEVSILLLKKAIQYAWLIKDKTKELYCYEELGINYFYMGNIEMSYYYHMR